MYEPRVDSCSKRIATALTIRGMKQADLCKAAKIPKSSLSLYISGAYEPKQDKIYAMALALNVSEAWLMGYNVPMDRKDIQKNTSPSDKMELTEGEAMLLNIFRLIPKEQQQVFLEMGRVYANSLKKD